MCSITLWQTWCGQEHGPLGRRQTGSVFSLNEVLACEVEFPLHSLCNIIFSLCYSFCQITHFSCGFVSKGSSQVLKSWVYMGQFTNSCALSSSILALSFRGLARTVAFNNQRKRSGDFRESAGSGLRERKMCVAVRLP